MMKILVSIAGPVFFLLAVVGASVWVGSVNKVRKDEIASAATELTPQIMVAALGALMLLALYLGTLDPMVGVWQSDVSQALSVVVGVVAGAGLAAAYIVAISPLHEYLIARFGDYVPAGDTTRVFANALPVFFVANILLAPLAEELVFRGYLFEVFESDFGLFWAVVLSTLAFGALHWLGGAWYMLITAVFAGGLLVALRIWTGGLMAPFVAHLTLNVIEFVWIASRSKAGG